MNKQNPIKEANELKEVIKDAKYKLNQSIITKDKKTIDIIYSIIINLETKLQTLQKANKQFAEVLGEEIEFLEYNKTCDDCGTIPHGNGNCHCKLNEWDNAFIEQISHLKQLKKEYEESLK